METKTTLNAGITTCLFPQAKTVYDVTVIRPYNTIELCRIYGITDKTFAKWLKPFLDEIGPKNGRFYTVVQVEIIFHKLGLPYRIKENC